MRAAMIYIRTDDLPVNKGLLDAWNTGRMFYDLSQRFYPVEFFDLCTVIEQIVLRDEIVLVGKFDRLPRLYSQALKPFIDAGVFKICIDAVKIEKGLATDPELRILAQQACRSGLTATSLQDGDYAVTRLLGAEITLRIPTTPLLQHLHNYQFFRRSVLDHTVCDVFSRYSDISARIQQVKAQDFRRARLKPLPIPPIALMVMQRAHNYEKLREQILAVRDEFRPLRDQMHSLGSMLGDPELSSEKFFQLSERWEANWLKAANIGIPSMVQVGMSTGQLLEGGREIASAYQNGATIGSVVTGLKMLDWLRSLAGQLTLRPVHLSVNNYIRTHPRQMVVAASRVFWEDPVVLKRKMEAVASPTSNLWREALLRQQR
jgi:hypothetical protein